jgi:hypothetical protein
MDWKNESVFIFQFTTRTNISLATRDALRSSSIAWVAATIGIASLLLWMKCAPFHC